MPMSRDFGRAAVPATPGPVSAAITRGAIRLGAAGEPERVFQNSEDSELPDEQPGV